MMLSKKSKLRPRHKYSFSAIGTHWDISFSPSLTQLQFSRLKSRLTHRIAVFDQHYSRFRSDSLVSNMSRHTGSFHLPADARPLFDLYHQLYRLTGGLFTPLIGQALSAAGYDASYSLQPADHIPIPPSWDDVLDYDYPYLSLSQPTLLDLGAAGKGYLIDIVAEILLSLGITEFSIDAGGDLLHHSSLPLTIGLEDPTDFSQVIATTSLSSGSLCASSGSRRHWDRFNHLLNPHTLSSPQQILATWVKAPTAILADSLATSLFFVGPEVLLSQFKFEYLLLLSDRSVRYSPNFFPHFFPPEQ